ncbi:MAG: glycosyltransferase family 9 protein [Bacteroidetes bacterium]|nr:glycosyltransferase family 9 protein [Bacteroidota bacterium]
MGMVPYTKAQRLPDDAHILIVRTDRVGDLVLTLPMIDSVKETYPQAHVSMLVQSYTKNLVENDQNVTSVLTYDGFKNIGSFCSFVRTLKEKNFTAAVVAYPRFLVALALWYARVPVRVGTGYRWYSFLFNRKVYEHRKRVQKHEAEYNLSLLQAIGCQMPEVLRCVLKLTEEEERKGAIVRESLGIRSQEVLIVLHPGSGGSARDWKKERFGELARVLLQRKYRVVISGTEREKELVSYVAQHAGAECLQFISTLSLREFAAFLKTAQCVVANSTGPLHLAAAVGTPVVGFYPPVKVMSPVRWGPLTLKKRIFVPDPSRCSRCNGRMCRGNDCMDQIEVNDVVTAVGELLKDDI